MMSRFHPAIHTLADQMGGRVRLLLACTLATLALGVALPAPRAQAAPTHAAQQSEPGAQQQSQPGDDEPVSQEAVGEGSLRFRILAGGLFVLALLLFGLALVYWRATTPPGKRLDLQ
jgi:hypothetical protein